VTRLLIQHLFEDFMKCIIIECSFIIYILQANLNLAVARWP